MMRQFNLIRCAVLLALGGVMLCQFAFTAPLPGDPAFVKRFIAVTEKLAELETSESPNASKLIEQLNAQVSWLVSAFEKNPDLLVTYLQAGYRPDNLLYSKLRERFAFAISQESQKRLQPAFEMLEHVRRTRPSSHPSPARSRSSARCICSKPSFRASQRN